MTSCPPDETLADAALAALAGLDLAMPDPSAAIDALRSAGVLAAPLLGVGTQPDGAAPLCALLRRLGGASLSLARLFEAHVNAIRLIDRFAAPPARAAMAADVREGHLFGLWVTDPPAGTGLRWDGRALSGRKGPCSGAGLCRRALVTVQTEDGVRMAVVRLSGAEPVTPIDGLLGMRGAANGTVRLDGAEVLAWPGEPGDYLREPDFSCGAWRTSAASLGGLDALALLVAAGLRAREQDAAPMQLARFGEIAIAQGTASLWVGRAMVAAEAAGGVDPEERVATVNLARIAVERACLDVIRHTQQALGLAAFVAPHPAERVMRDLSTYLRQPAGDTVLLEAASWQLARA